MNIIKLSLAASLMLASYSAFAQEPEYQMVIQLDDETRMTIPTSRITGITFSDNELPEEVYNILTPLFIPDAAFRDFIQHNIARGADTFTNVEAALWDKPFDMKFTEARNIEGIEYFTSLTDVNLSNNDYLTTANLSALKKLKKLDISYCAQLGELRLEGVNGLESIDISSTALKSFRLNSLPKTMREIRCDNMQYPELDPKLFPVLEKLQASQCNFTSIDFSDHASICEVTISGNALTSAKFANCRMLEYLALSYNPDLVTLDLGGVTNLKNLYIHNTGLNGFDFWQFRNTLMELNIGYLQGYDFHLIDLPQLTYLECQNCSLEGDLTITSPLLEVLRCEENQLTKVDVSACSYLKSFHCYGMESMETILLPEEQSDVELLFFRGMPKVTELKITNINNIQYFTVSGLGIKSLNLSQGSPDGTYGLRYNPDLVTVNVWTGFDAEAMGERWSVYECPNMTVVVDE